jgi:anti-sigma factor RsiW
MSNPEHELDCEQTLDAAVYVLGALEEHEAQAYAEHLNDCVTCSAEVSKLQVSSDSLALAVPQMLAPVNLRARIMSTVHAEAELLKAAGHEADRPIRARARWRWRLVPVAASAAALAVGLFVGAVAINGGSTKTRVVHSAQASRVITAAVTSPGHRATAVLHEQGGQSLLEVANLPAPPHGRIY